LEKAIILGYHHQKANSLMKMNIPIFLLCIPILGFSQYAEEDSSEPYIYATRKASTSINQDVNIRANEWRGYKTVSSFNNYWPNNTGRVENQTEVKVTY